jgi:hypothetical protein
VFLGIIAWKQNPWPVVILPFLANAVAGLFLPIDTPLGGPNLPLGKVGCFHRRRRSRDLVPSETRMGTGYRITPAGLRRVHARVDPSQASDRTMAEAFVSIRPARRPTARIPSDLINARFSLPNSHPMEIKN